ncbi:LLM class flavin-dependent oxidoreductase [Microvirga alba]|uniref:Luciferase-like monooxygenase n=1 Tax=Microvirga alba TaxID=2791025 RepID=A0A931BN35_9HYPH|nr:LLM class flavin-dependent oxidoreductase [Microvirga alba]MBF9234177.1 LLM class flavin-dependent oxidoreductase [Microvirga alba]
MLPISVLDLSFVTSGSTPAQALRNTLDLARHADGLGYTRYWVAEHHNLPSVASGAPEIMIGQIAAVTERIRVGSGGVMLPNHAPLMVAERFKLLEALFPGRIDLGLGRAPGTDPVTSYALRRFQEERGRDDFQERLQELMLLENRRIPEGHPFRKIEVMPSGVPLPPIWLLGSSDYSSHLSAQLGMGFAFAHHFASHDATDAMLSYRNGFTPSEWRREPHAILTVAAICAETDEEAERIASSADLNVLRRMRGEYGPLPSPEEALAYPYTSSEREAIQRNRARLFVGSPERLRTLVTPLIEATKADELMVTAAIHDHGARKRSYELVAVVFGRKGG